MSRYYYKKTRQEKTKQLVRFVGIFLFVCGLTVMFYTLFPILSWQLFFAHANYSEGLSTPIPKSTVVNSSTIATLLENSQSLLRGIDYTNAQNWFPNVQISGGKATVDTYTISVPKLGIKKAIVSTQDYDLSKHLINYPGTPTPSQSGNTIIFGHSSLPQLFSNDNYKTIFATLYKIKIGDEIIVTSNNAIYTYKVFTILITDPTDTSIFEQYYDTGYVTLVTCTPPGTTWKRLIVKSRLEKI